MKKIILFLCFLPVILHAQNSNTTRVITPNTRPTVTKEQRDSVIKHSDLIFEGRVLLGYSTLLSGSPFTNEDAFTGNILLFQISKVLKGSNNYIGEIIEVHAPLISIESGFVTIGDSRNIVVCNKSSTQTSYFNMEDVKTKFKRYGKEYNLKNKSSFKVIGSISEGRGRGRGAFGLGYSLDNYQFAIDSLLTEYPELEVLPKPQKSKSAIEEEKARNEYWKQKNEENLRKIFVNDSLRYEKAKKKSNYSLLKSTDTELYLKIDSIKNIRVEDERWLQFSIMAKASQAGTFLENTTFRLEYDSVDAFEGNSFSKQNVQIERGLSFRDDFRYDSIFITDYNSSTLLINFAAKVDTNCIANRVELSTSYIQLMNAKIKIKNPVEFTPLILKEGPFFYIDLYAPNPDTCTWMFYDTTYYEYDSIYPLAPKPIINSITSHASAGTGTHVMIAGKYFGNVEIPDYYSLTMNSNIQFRNAHEDDSLYAKLNNSDYVKWKDDTIRLILPGVLYDWKKYIRSAPATGTVKIITDWGTETTSSDSIIIPYCLIQSLDGGLNKQNIYIPRVNCTDGILFRAGETLVTDTTAMAVIKKAMRDWSTELGITIAFEKDSLDNILTVSSPSTSPDGINTLFAGCYNQNLMTTLVYDLKFLYPNGLHSNCGTDSAQNVVDGLKERDIAICFSENWNYDTTGSSITGYAFYDVILHELGHAIGLNHSRNYNDLMYPTVDVNPTASQRRSLSSGAGYALIGADELIKRSESTTWSCTGLETLNSPNIGDCPVDAPTNLTTSPVSSAKISIEWDAVEGASSYDVYSCEGSYIANTIVNSYEHIGLSAETLYSYKVKAKNSSYTSPFSSCVSDYTLPVGAKHIDPILVGTLNVGNSYTDTKNNSVSNNFGDYYGEMPNYTGNQTSDDIFYKFTLSESSNVTISTAGSAVYSTVLHLHDNSYSHLYTSFVGPADPCERNYLAETTIYLSAGTYYVISEGEDNTSGSIKTTISVSSFKSALAKETISDIEHESSDFTINEIVTVYPNPTENVVNLKFNEVQKSVTISIISANGMKVHESSCHACQLETLDVSHLNSGTYLVNINMGAKIVTKKIQVQ